MIVVDGIITNAVPIMDFVELELQYQTKISRLRVCIVSHAAFRHVEQV